MTPARGVALLGLLVLLASLLPWWRHDVDDAGPDGSGTLVLTATAWGASWGWAAAATAAALAGVAALRARAGAAAVLSAAGVVLLAGPLLLAVSGSFLDPDAGLTYDTYELTDETADTYDTYLSDEELYRVERGQLLLSDEAGYRSVPGVGLYLGAGLLLAQAVLAVRGARAGVSRSGPSAAS